jgi:ABC-type multidrug transport system permease subunit
VSALWVLAKQRVLDVTRDRASAFFYFLLPVLILGVLAVVFERGHPFERKAVALVGSEAAILTLDGALAGLPELRVSHESSERAALGQLRARAVNLVVLAGEREHVILTGPNERLLAAGLASTLRLRAEARVVDVPHFGYLHFLFPGLLTSAVMFAGLFGMGHAMVRFRENLFLKKLATTRLSKTTFITAQLLGRGALVSVQVTLLVVVLILGFELPITPRAALAIALLSALGLLVFSGIGFALACVIKSDAVMSDLINSVTLPIALLSGMFFSTAALPGALARVSAGLPSTLLVDALRSTVLYDAPLAAEWRPIVALGAWAFASFVVSVSFFRWHR